MIQGLHPGVNIDGSWPPILANSLCFPLSSFRHSTCRHTREYIHNCSALARREVKEREHGML